MDGPNEREVILRKLQEMKHHSKGFTCPPIQWRNFTISHYTDDESNRFAGTTITATHVSEVDFTKMSPTDLVVAFMYVTKQYYMEFD